MRNTANKNVVVEDTDVEIATSVAAQKTALVTPADTYDVMMQILKELKKMNLHLAQLSDNDFNDEDVEV